MHRTVVVATALAVGLAGCGRAGERPSTDLLVSAASSLTGAFEELAADFEAAHPGTNVTLNLAGTSTLRAQLLAGAPVDVFASASPTIMDEVAAAQLVRGTPVTFARNRLVLAVPAGNPAAVTGLEDLADDALLVGLCAPQVPCGDFARQALAAVGVTPTVDSYEPDVRALLSRIELGELDAGMVYASDVLHANVDTVPIPDEATVTVDYTIAALTAAPNPVAGANFVAFMRSHAAQAILADFGFQTP